MSNDITSSLSNRITRKDIDRVVELIAQEMGVPFGHYARVSSIHPLPGHVRVLRESSDHSLLCTLPNGLAVDYAACDGGYTITQMTDHVYDDGRPGTGVSHPFGPRRYTGRHAFDVFYGILAGLRAGKRAAQ